jgi:predicted DNA-binding transcriptional regulator AlpA
MVSTSTETSPSQEIPAPAGFCDERYAASYLSVSVETLRSWRRQGRGPRFRKLGRCVRYLASDLAAFIEALPAGGGRAA